jgi:hypothetical protein
VTAPRDPGLQPERTELAWRRTLLSIAVGSLVSLRVLPPVLGDWTVAVGVTGVVVAALLWVLAQRRHRAVDRVFHGLPAAGMPGGALLLAVTVLTAAGAALGLLVALLPT